MTPDSGYPEWGRAVGRIGRVGREWAVGLHGRRGADGDGIRSRRPPGPRSAAVS